MPLPAARPILCGAVSDLLLQTMLTRVLLLEPLHRRVWTVRSSLVASSRITFVAYSGLKPCATSTARCHALLTLFTCSPASLPNR
jgi:hypothetical protein